MSKKSIKSDLAKIDLMTDEDIDYSDIPPLGDEYFEKAIVVLPTLGKLKYKVFGIFHTTRSVRSRIILMRKAKKREQEIY